MKGNQDPTFLQKNTGPGGGNNYLSAQYHEKQKGEVTHNRKMEEIRKSIYGIKSDA